MYVNRTTGEIYIGNGNNEPVEVTGMSSGPIDVGNVQTVSGYTFDEMVSKLLDSLYRNGFSGTGSKPPAKKDLVVGNIVVMSNFEWIVAHVTETEAYLTLNGSDGKSTWSNLQSTCTTWSNENIAENLKASMKIIKAGNTNGYVFVATREQMNGGFIYFNSNNRRKINSEYWTSSEGESSLGLSVYPDGNFNYGAGKGQSYGFRPSVALDLTLLE